jgi:hypothetical protein
MIGVVVTGSTTSMKSTVRCQSPFRHSPRLVCPCIFFVRNLKDMDQAKDDGLAIGSRTRFDPATIDAFGQSFVWRVQRL